MRVLQLHRSHWVRLRGQWEEVHEPLETAEAQIYHCQGKWFWVVWWLDMPEFGVAPTFDAAKRAAEASFRYHSDTESQVRHVLREYVLVRETDLTADALALREKIIRAVSAALEQAGEQ